MSLKTWLLILIYLVNYNVSNGQELRCVYALRTYYGYTCDLIIQNPYGLNNFTKINGTHMSQMGNADVLALHGLNSFSNTTNIPSIICETFTNIKDVSLEQMGIITIDENSFKNCIYLTRLYLPENKITTINANSFNRNTHLQDCYLYHNQLTTVPENLFVNSQNLRVVWLNNNKIIDLPKKIFSSSKLMEMLYLQNNEIKILRPEWFEHLEIMNIMNLYSNKIEELPKYVFSNMKNLLYLSLANNKLKVIHSDSFGVMMNFNFVYFENNQINAIDQRLIDNTKLLRIDMTNNTCASDDIYDDSELRQTMRMALSACFANYKSLFPGMIFKI